MEIHEQLREELASRLAYKKEELERHKDTNTFYMHQLEGVVWTLEDVLQSIRRLEIWAKRN